MSFDLSKVVSEVEGVVNLLAPAATLFSAIAAVAPAGTGAATILTSVQAGLTSAVNASGGIESDVAEIWPHIQSIITAAEGIFSAFKASPTTSTAAAS